MTATKRRLWMRLAGTLVLLVAVLGGWLWTLQPERGSKWAVTILMLPAAWGCGALLRRLGGWRGMSESDELRLLRAMAGAGAILAAALGLALAEALELAGGNATERGVGVVMGLVLVVIGNFMPKNVEPARPGCEPSAVQALQRFSGWTFVIAGLAYAAAYLALPLDSAGPVSIVLVAAAVVLVAVRLLRAMRPRRGAAPPVGP